MLKYERNKLVRIWKKNKDILEVQGILDDDIYSAELKVAVDISSLEIKTIEGKWNRWTTPECHRSLLPLQEAIGFCINDNDFSQNVHKIIGRKSCRHFANLLLECCHSVKEATKIILWEEKRKIAPELKFEDFLNGITDNESTRDNMSDKVVKAVNIITKESVKRQSPEKNRSGSMIIDLHTHSYPASPCSSVSVEDLIVNAKQKGLNGICLTDHNYVWDQRTVEQLSEHYEFLVLRGNEITTNQGDMIVFGFEKNIKGIIRLEDLKKEVDKAKGFIIAAHPFRGFLTFGVSQLGLTIEKAVQRSLFKSVNAIETLNGKVTQKENSFAAEVAKALNLPQTGGSDAHLADEVGIYATRFTDTIKNENDLVQALRDKNYSPEVF